MLITLPKIGVVNELHGSCPDSRIKANELAPKQPPIADNNGSIVAVGGVQDRASLSRVHVMFHPKSNKRGYHGIRRIAVFWAYVVGRFA